MRPWIRQRDLSEPERLGARHAVGAGCQLDLSGLDGDGGLLMADDGGRAPPG